MSWRWLFSPWGSLALFLTTIAITVAVFLLTGMLFIFFILPVSFLLWAIRRKN